MALDAALEALREHLHDLEVQVEKTKAAIGVIEDLESGPRAEALRKGVVTMTAVREVQPGQLVTDRDVKPANATPEREKGGCSKCGERGHNARTCKRKEGKPAADDEDDPVEKPVAPVGKPPAPSRLDRIKVAANGKRIHSGVNLW